MFSVLFSVTLFVFGLIFKCGDATYQCPLPPTSSLVYFDLEQLGLITLQDFTNAIKSPLICGRGSNETCDDQPCCPDEVGCCFTSNNKCGCKLPGEKTCSYPAPYAIMGNSACDAGQTATITACLREHRGPTDDNMFTKNSFLQARNALDGPVQQTTTHVVQDVVLTTRNTVKKQCRGKGIFTQEFTADVLADLLERTLIDQLIQIVEERKFKGQPYGNTKVCL